MRALVYRLSLSKRGPLYLRLKHQMPTDAPGKVTAPNREQQQTFDVLLQRRRLPLGRSAELTRLLNHALQNLVLESFSEGSLNIDSMPALTLVNGSERRPDLNLVVRLANACSRNHM
jgi:hypothetical protein